MPRGPDPETPPELVLEQFVVSPDPAFVPSEIAEALGITTEGARHRMNKLVEKGYLSKKKPGERTVIYWITPAGREYYAENADSS